MILNFIKNLLARTAAKQLRKPAGWLAGKVGNEMNKTNKFLYDFTFEHMQLKDHEAVLEIGFGNGKFFKQLLAKAHNLSVSGIDFSQDMVREAIRNNAELINNGSLKLYAGSSDAMPFADQSFDKIFCINVVYFWDQPKAHLNEIFRVLKPGGKIYASVRTKETMELMPFSKYGFHIYTQDEWIQLLNACQLKFLRSERTSNERDVLLGNKNYKAASLCLVAQKDHLPEESAYFN